MNASCEVLVRAAAVVLLCVLCGCATASLRDAQDHFNKGAELEARALEPSLLSDNPTANPGDALAAANEYRMAYATTAELIAENADDLRQDKLLGATYVLHAMALWRISDLQGDALDEGERRSEEHRRGGQQVVLAGSPPATSRQELLAILDEIREKSETEVITLGTRDQVLSKTLYGFYDHDGGRSADDYQDARQWFRSALTRLDEALSSEVPPGHPVRVYVGSAQLRTLAAWKQSRYAEVKRCPSSLEDRPDNCTAIDVLTSDDDTIFTETTRVVCEMEPFWKDNPDLEKQLKVLLVPLGQPNAFQAC